MLVDAAYAERMKHDPHWARRLVFWLLLASAFAMGVVLLFLVPNHRISGALALGIVAVLILKHVGLLMIAGSPLIGAFSAIRRNLAIAWRKPCAEPR
jgi:hypothetical protein